MGQRDTLTRDSDDRHGPRDDRVPQLFVLIECDRPSAGSSRHVLAGLREVRLGRTGEREVRRAEGTLTLGIPDARMSAPHARLVQQDGRWYAEDAGSKNGLIVDQERRSRIVLADGAVLELGHTLLLFREAPDVDGEPVDRDAGRPGPRLRTFLAPLARAFDDLAAVVRTPAPVLIQGETGTGKEIVARAAHELSQRSGPFVAVNCGALPETLIESELFGHRRGAFSGADQDRPGLVRSADRGTLFLDEIADLALPSQAALLRVLQEREVTPVGSAQPVAVDVRIVAATHHDLAQRVAQDRFRRDLYARLASYTVALPPLRQRREDLGLLLQALLVDHPDVRLSCAAVNALLEYDWPLNVRELASALTVATALARGGPIKLAHLPAPVRGGEPESTDRLAPEDAQLRDQLVALLTAHAGNVSAVARATGKARAQIHRWLRRFGLEPESYR
jgi:DNA-binding NtrC family response regulator